MNTYLKLKEKYRNNLPQKINALLELQKKYPNADISHIRSLAHTLAGSGGIYGYPELSKLAKSTEHARVEEIPYKLEQLLVLLNTIVSCSLMFQHNDDFWDEVGDVKNLSRSNEDVITLVTIKDQFKTMQINQLLLQNINHAVAATEYDNTCYIFAYVDISLNILRSEIENAIENIQRIYFGTDGTEQKISPLIYHVDTFKMQEPIQDIKRKFLENLSLRWRKMS